MAKNTGKKIIAGMVATAIVAGAGVVGGMAIQNAYADPNAGDNTQTESPAVDYEKIELQEKLAEAQANLSEAQAQLATKVAELEALQSSTDSQIENLNGQISQQDAEITELNTEIDNLLTEIDLLNRALRGEFTSARYLIFDEHGEVIGLSVDGLIAMHTGKMTELVLPSSYSIGEIVNVERTFTDFTALDLFCQTTGVFDFSFNYNDTEYVIASEADYNTYNAEISEYLANGKSITTISEEQQYLDGEEYAVVSIAYDAFQETFFNKIKFPATITKINNGAFRNCNATIFDFSDCTSIPRIGSGSISSMMEDYSIYVPDELYDEWIADSKWSNYADHIFKASEM